MISSRTPEGEPNRCPVCGRGCRVEPSSTHRDGPCPHCGHLLWFADSGRPIDALAVVMEIVEMKFGPQASNLVTEVSGVIERVGCEELLLRAVTAQTLTELLADDDKR